MPGPGSDKENRGSVDDADASSGSRLECRACAVICERVVYPAHCLRSGCGFVYAFCDAETTYFGCLAKVFEVELDLSVHRPSRDVYGALKAARDPRPECRVEVERAYQHQYTWQGCRNPLFAHVPEDYSPEAVRRLVHGATTPGADTGGPRRRDPAPETD